MDFAENGHNEPPFTAGCSTLLSLLYHIEKKGARNEKTIFETYFCGAASMRYGNPSPDLAVKILVRESWFKEDCRPAGFVIE
ncbi:MAG: hypothetical protein SOW80_00495 [Anaerovoracaceae bacterium]|nr:hypothetical protein [Anaerovoracaceae bacterium]